MDSSKRAQIKNDVLSGLTVSLALVPEAVAFSLVAGVAPLSGLYAAFMVGLITALLGRPGMISGATGAMAVVMVSLVADHGVEYLFAAVVLTGCLQVGAGFLGLGKFIRMVPHPVMLGFVNGLAIVIFLAQLNQFKVQGADGTLQWLSGSALYGMLGLVGLTMLIIYLLPKWTRAVPASLAAILVVTFVAVASGLETRTVGDIASIAGSLPSFKIPDVPFSLETLGIIFPYAAVLAGIGLIESLLTLNVIDEMTETRGHMNRECKAQGLANMVTGMIGGMGGCAMIGQSMINISSGGRTRVSGVVAAVCLLGFILFASPLIEQIPIAALTGVMFMVVIGTFEWSSLRILGKIPATDAFVLIMVSTVTVFTDLAVAVILGVVVSSLVFAWQHAKHFNANIHYFADRKRYEVRGSLYFGSIKEFLDLFDVGGDPKEVEIDFAHAKVCDHSGLEAIDRLHERYIKQGKSLVLKNLSKDCHGLLEKSTVKSHLLGLA